MIRFLAGLLLAALLAATPAHAQTFPKLTGRVVDQAGLLTPQQEADLSAKSEALEQRTGRQFVIATVRSLEGRPIPAENNSGNKSRATQMHSAAPSALEISALA